MEWRHAEETRITTIPGPGASTKHITITPCIQGTPMTCNSNKDFATFDLNRRRSGKQAWPLWPQLYIYIHIYIYIHFLSAIQTLGPSIPALRGHDIAPCLDGRTIGPQPGAMWLALRSGYHHTPMLIHIDYRWCLEAGQSWEVAMKTWTLWTPKHKSCNQVYSKSQKDTWIYIYNI